MGVAEGHVTQFRNFGTPNNFWTNRAIHFKFGTDIEDGPSLRMDYKTTPKWAWPGSRDLILGPPNNFWRNWDTRFKFGTDVEDAPIWRADHKITHKWAWPGSRDRISKFWDPFITFERIEQSASSFVQKWRWYNTALHWHSGDELQSNITFFFISAVLVVWHPYSRPYKSL